MVYARAFILALVAAACGGAPRSASVPSPAADPLPTITATDRDGDGVVDDEDGCPDEWANPGSAGQQGGGCPYRDAAPAAPAAPAAQAGDQDGDGFADARDACPAAHGPKESMGDPGNGCPSCGDMVCSPSESPSTCRVDCP